MSAETPYAVIASLVVASLGLWWFRVIMSNVRNMPKTTRYGVYALVFLAYFVLTMMLVSRSGS